MSYYTLLKCRFTNLSANHINTLDKPTNTPYYIDRLMIWRNPKLTIKEQLKALPSCPGVYLMKGSDQNIIYVGKSKHLKNRVTTYFQTPDPEDKKALKLYHSIKSFDIITTDTELEALLLECQLIKKYKPWCNRLMKNPEAYVYLKFTMNDEYPDLFLCEEKGEDGALYFGPYHKRSSTERALDVLRTLYKMPCTKYSRTASPCMNYSLGKCEGICIGKISKELHQKKIQEILAFLKGSTALLEQLEQTMITAAEGFEFEQAALLRDQMTALSYLSKQAKLLSFAASAPLLLVTEMLSSSEGKVLLFYRTQLVFQKKLFIDSSNSAALKSLANELFQVLPEERSTHPLTKQDIDEFHILYSYVNNHQNNCNYFVFKQDCNEEMNVSKLYKILTELFSM